MECLIDEPDGRSRIRKEEEIVWHTMLEKRILPFVPQDHRHHRNVQRTLNICKNPTECEQLEGRYREYTEKAAYRAFGKIAHAFQKGIQASVALQGAVEKKRLKRNPELVISIPPLKPLEKSQWKHLPLTRKEEEEKEPSWLGKSALSKISTISVLLFAGLQLALKILKKAYENRGVA